MNNVRFVGLDVHAETIAVAVAEPGGEVRSLGVIPNRAVPTDILHFLARVVVTPTDAPYRPRVVERREETADDQVHADHGPQQRYDHLCSQNCVVF